MFAPKLVLGALLTALAAPQVAGQATRAAVPNANPDAPRPGELTGSVERVIVFKDGHGLFVRRVSAVADAEGRVFTFEVPEATLGAFWAQAEGREIAAMRAERVDASDARVEDSTCLTTQEILRANAGRQVTVTTDKGDFTGKLVGTLDAPAIPGARPPLGERRVLEQVPRGGDLIALDTSRGRLVLPVSSVHTVLGQDLVLGCKRTMLAVEARKRLTLEFGKAAAGSTVKLRLFYFAPGIRWIPTYRLHSGDGAKAELALSGELLNEVEDLKGAALDLVVGVPHFKFQDLPSPLALEQRLRHALAQAAPGLMGNDNNRFSNALFTQRAVEHHRAIDDGPLDEGGSLGLAPELAAERSQDLFTYSAKNVVLPKGARASLPLWRTQVAQRHVYTLDLAVRRSGSSYSYASQDSDSPQQLRRNQVWHQVELSNPTQQPWTTGAALVLQGELPIAQDLLGYTPPGGRTLLPLTVAVDVQAQHQEEVLERRPDALRVDGRSYTLVRKKGTITVRSFRAEPSAVVITLATGGKVDAESARIVHGDHRPEDGVAPIANGHATVTWERTLDAKASRTLSYQVVVYE